MLLKNHKWGKFCIGLQKTVPSLYTFGLKKIISEIFLSQKCKKLCCFTENSIDFKQIRALNIPNNIRNHLTFEIKLEIKNEICWDCEDIKIY